MWTVSLNKKGTYDEIEGFYKRVFNYISLYEMAEVISEHSVCFTNYMVCKGAFPRRGLNCKLEGIQLSVIRGYIDTCRYTTAGSFIDMLKHEGFKRCFICSSGGITSDIYYYRSSVVQVAISDELGLNTTLSYYGGTLIMSGDFKALPDGCFGGARTCNGDIIFDVHKDIRSLCLSSFRDNKSLLRDKFFVSDDIVSLEAVLLPCLLPHGETYAHWEYSGTIDINRLKNWVLLMKLYELYTDDFKEVLRGIIKQVSKSIEASPPYTSDIMAAVNKHVNKVLSSMGRLG